jgi:hypothetical protein
MSGSVAVATEADEFLGLDAEQCCVDCGPDHCVITQDGICGHPRKAGIQSVHKANPEIVQRFNRARKYLLIAEAKKGSD